MKNDGQLRRTGSWILAAALALVMACPGTASADKASFRCRNAVAKAILLLTKTGLKTIDKCHKKRNRSGQTTDCNVLAVSASAPYGRAENRVRGSVGAACGPDDPVRGNYPPPSAAGIDNILEVLLPEIRLRIEENSAELLGAPAFTADRRAVKALGRCHGAVGAGRSRIILSIAQSAFRCQKRLDKRATDYGAIDPSCLGGAGGAGAQATRAIGKACGATTGSEIDSCPTLPDCVVTAAEDTGQGFAGITFGGPTQCGNGARELGEECDDGNTVASDDCTDTCANAVCGDGVVRAGMEECDDGNDIPDDACNACQNPVCGDGVLAVGAEDCDDGNTSPGDGCSPTCTIEAVVCADDGVIATVAFDYQPTLNIAGGDLRLEYPGVVSLPGSSGAPSVRTRVTNLTGIDQAVFSARDFDVLGSDGTDDTLAILFAHTGRIPPGDFAEVVFDCVPGSEILPEEFSCHVENLSDDFTNPIMPDPADVPCGVTTLVLPGGATTTTATTMPPPTTSVTTTTTMSSTTSTILTTCGDQVVDVGEECDDGNVNPSDGCTLGCTICGNGSVTAPEQCDDSNLTNGDGCDSNCSSTACGNTLVVAPETCDDGNTDNNDSCPADCIVDACTAVAASDRTVTVNFSGANVVAGLTVFLDYPEGRVSIPGSGGQIPVGTITDLPPFTFGQGNDLDHALRQVIASDFAITTSQLFKVHFEDCQGAPAPTPGNFACAVLDAGDENLNPVPGVTCSVTIP